jgi:protein-S-isoprenylcysteine O-methyltransferase Ste14
VFRVEFPGDDADVNSQVASNQPPGIDRRRLLRILVGLPVFFAIFMFLPAGSLAWLKGWLFLLFFLGALAAGTLFLWRANPEVIAARSRIHEGTKRWDRVLLCVFLPSMYAIVPVAALDDCRFHWFPLPWWVSGVGYVCMSVGLGFSVWAEAVNKFFEPTVRIQTDRGQTVIDTGPYAIVRHPGYVGIFFMALGTALALGSFWALIPASVATVLLIIRTLWEDETLQAELTGYKHYASRVRYRLIPGIW